MAANTSIASSPSRQPHVIFKVGAVASILSPSIFERP
jgi:hypothetical protein